MGQGLWTKVQQMVAYGLGMIKCEGSEDLLERVRLLQTDTLSFVQSSYTSSSTTSENCCEAVRLCCSVLVERLKPTVNEILDNASSVTWDMLIQQIRDLRNAIAENGRLPVSNLKMILRGMALQDQEDGDDSYVTLKEQDSLIIVVIPKRPVGAEICDDDDDELVNNRPLIYVCIN